MEPITKMNNQIMSDIAKEQDLHGHDKLRKADLIAILSEHSTQEMPPEQSTQEMPIPQPGMSVHPVKIIPHPQEADRLEERDEKEQPSDKKKTS